ncbi:hypothetical protein [Stenotrophomonas sp. 278]|uniref:hypothetical protein n=1 Tax=Stenotrophomonas sp. 278 TaxID=2479851 RepID=UPI000F663DCD|nr:hypothetical protein [Stenotrophomonas sp. 278]RRT99356.1 hypothetical protein EGJ34_20985 [Stenotrophomonas sp. 278]
MKPRKQSFNRREAGETIAHLIEDVLRLNARETEKLAARRFLAFPDLILAALVFSAAFVFVALMPT